LSKLEPDISRSQHTERGVCERGSLDQQLKGSLKLELGVNFGTCEERLNDVKTEMEIKHRVCQSAAPTNNSHGSCANNTEQVVLW